MLRSNFWNGYRQAFKKLALSPPTQVDNFVEAVEHGKDMPPDATAMPTMDGPPPEAPPGASLGADAAKAAAQFTLNETPWGMERTLVPPRMPQQPGGVFSSSPPPRAMPARPQPPPIPAAALHR